MSFSFLDDWRILEEAVPGEIIKVRSRYKTRRGGPPEPDEDPSLADMGEALVASEDDEGVFWVSYLELERDVAASEGWRARVGYQKRHDEEFYCGEEFGELQAATMPRLGAISPPEDLPAKKAFFEAKMEVLREQARRDAERELIEEAKKLGSGAAPYPPEEGLLASVIRELGRA